MSGYVLDDLALIAGLTTDGAEHHRREMSRLLIAAIDRGPAIAVPAVCLATAAVRRPAIVDHLAELLTDGPPGAIKIVGLARNAEVTQLRIEHPGLAWPALHAASTAIANRIPVVTTDASRYAGTVVEAIDL